VTPDPVGRARRRAWRTWYATRWRLWQQRQQGRVRIRRVDGLDVVVLPGLLDPAWFLSSDVLVDAIGALVRPGDRVLDLGSGTGIGALAALRAGARRVVATDVDPVAFRCIRATLAIADAAERVAVRHGDLFEPLDDECFDLIAFNPPWLTGSVTGLETATRLDPGLPARLAGGLAAHLAPNGRVALILSTHGRPDAWLDPLRAAGCSVDALLERDRGSEVITAWQVRPPGV